MSFFAIVNKQTGECIQVSTSDLTGAGAAELPNGFEQVVVESKPEPGKMTYDEASNSLLVDEEGRATEEAAILRSLAIDLYARRIAIDAAQVGTGFDYSPELEAIDAKILALKNRIDELDAIVTAAVAVEE